MSDGAIGNGRGKQAFAMLLGAGAITLGFLAAHYITGNDDSVKELARTINETSKTVIEIKGDVKELRATVNANGAFYKDKLDNLDKRQDRLERADRRPPSHGGALPD